MASGVKKGKVRLRAFKCPICMDHGDVSGMSVYDNPGGERIYVCKECAKEIARAISKLRP